MKPSILEALSDGQALALCVVDEHGQISQKMILPDDFDENTLVTLQVYIDQDLPASVLRYVQVEQQTMQADFDLSSGCLAVVDAADGLVSTEDVTIPAGCYEACLTIVPMGEMQSDEQLQAAYQEQVAQLAMEALGKERYEKAKAEKEKCIQQGCLVILLLVLAMALAAWLLPAEYKVVAMIFIAILFVCERLLFDPTKDIATLCQIEEAQAPYYFADGILQLTSKSK